MAWMILDTRTVFYAEVILLRKEGRRLPRREWSAPMYGKIVVEDSEPNASNFRRLMRKMTLAQRVGASSMRIAAALYDPYFLPSIDGATMIAGIEIVASVQKGEICEHSQIWMCRTRATPDEEREDLRRGIEAQLPQT